MIPARIAIWALSIGAVVLIFLILGGSEDAQAKVGWATVLFVIFSLNSLAGFLLIQRRPEQTPFGAATLALSVAAYFVLLDSFFSHGCSRCTTPSGYSSSSPSSPDRPRCCSPSGATRTAR